MKQVYLLFTLCILSGVLVFAAPRYWVGPLNGNWNNNANWSATSGGPGGAGVPGAEDSVIFNADALVNVNISPVINSLRIGSGRNVTLYTSVPVAFTLRRNLFIDVFCTLKDSTSADVPFNFIFNGATGAAASITGTWIFEGGVPVSSGNGPTFTAQAGSRVRLGSVFAVNGGGGTITFRKNTADITSNPSTLVFGPNTAFNLDNNPEGAVPDATWAQDILSFPFYTGFRDSAAATLMLTGSISGELRHLSAVPSYGRIAVNLSALTGDASLAMPNGSRIRGNLDITNTNNHTLTILSGTSPTGNVDVELGVLNNGFNFGGYLNISGNSTRVALARAPDTAPSTSYRLQIDKSFNQSGGNFSLQDADESTGSSTLAIKSDLIQTGGTFFTNSTATGPATKFIVIMDDPPFITGPSGLFGSNRTIRMSSGTIDNGRGMVTLRLNHSVYYFPAIPNDPNGVTLESPLTVGRLDLFRGPLNTSAANIITITNPDAATAVQLGTTGRSYVNGPLRRWTNSSDAYVFPTGKGNTSPASYVFDSCVVIPVSDEPSLYQAEYFKTRYTDTLNVRLPLRGVSTAEYWDISKISGAGARIQLTVNAKVPLTTSGDVLVVAHYANGEWVSEQESLLMPGDTANGSVVSRPLSDFSPFTFGYYAYSDTPPLEVKCPPDMIVNTDPNTCSALVQFRAEAGEHTTVVYKTGSTVITSPYNFPKGTTTVDVTASDNTGTVTCSFTVTVNDVQAPEITGISANPARLSTVENELRNVHVDYTITDNCGPVTTTLSVTSNQASTDSNADWEITDNHTIRLRDAQSGQDRIYTIAITSTDEAGNQTVKTVDVLVPKTTVTEKIKLDLRIMPNPSKNYFTLDVRSNSDKPATLQVFDLFGRVKEVRRFYPDATIRLGDNYRPGVYFVKITQGNVEVYTALLKL